MDFQLTKFQKAVCRSVYDLNRNGFNNSIFADDEAGKFPLEKWKLCGDIGIHGLPIPEEYGGAGQDMLTCALAIEALGYTCLDEGLIFSICAHICTCAIPIMQFGDEFQKRKFLPDLASGSHIGGNGTTEANAGSESSAMITQVVAQKDGYRLNGTKIFVTNAPVADLLIVYAKHPGGIRMLDISAFIIEKDNPGMSIGQVFQKMGLRTSPLSEVVLKNCTVKKNYCLGKEKRGMAVFNESMLWERILMSAYHIGAMEQQYRTILAHANSREQFGRKIVKHSKVADKLIRMKMRIEASQLMLYKTSWDHGRNKCDLADASKLKLMTSESKVKNSLEAVQISGAYGYMKENIIEKQLRDSMSATIYSGTSEMQKIIMGEKL